jgi:hypothetical protein
MIPYSFNWHLSKTEEKMICFTVLNDQAPFPGISLASNRKSGYHGNFCSVANGESYPPPVIIPAPTLTPIFQPLGGTREVVIDASAICEWHEKAKSHPILIAPRPNDSRNAALVQWLIDPSMVIRWGEYQGGTTVNAENIDETRLLDGWHKFLLKVESCGIVTLKYRFASLALHLDGQNLGISRQ